VPLRSIGQAQQTLYKRLPWFSGTSWWILIYLRMPGQFFEKRHRHNLRKLSNSSIVAASILEHKPVPSHSIGEWGGRYQISSGISSMLTRVMETGINPSMTSPGCNLECTPQYCPNKTRLQAPPKSLGKQANSFKPGNPADTLSCAFPG